MENNPAQTSPACWFCERPAGYVCRCRRAYCEQHGEGQLCLLCSLAYGVYEEHAKPNYVADLIMLSLAAAAGDPYIVVPGAMHGAGKLPMAGVERLIGGLAQVAQAGDLRVQGRAAETLASITVSWPTMDPSQVSRQNYGMGLLSAEPVRKTLLALMREHRNGPGESVAVAILDKLRNADFRALYPGISSKLNMRYARANACVQELIQALGDVYPTRSYQINERCELLVYEQYVDRKRGAGDMMERMYGPMLRHAPPLAHILKKGVWHADYARFQDWYPGEDEPL